jgi:hypothetical protein
MQKLFCYVDESGQDTKGQFFVVAVTIVGKDRDEMRKFLEQIEIDSGKKKTKWRRTKVELKIAYFEKIITSRHFDGSIFCTISRESTTYRDTTIVTIASAINEYRSGERYKASVFIDGLKKSEVKMVGTGLRRIGIHTEKVRGVRDESDVFIRLADSVAGLARDYFNKEKFALEIFQKATKKKVIKLL